MSKTEKSKRWHTAQRFLKSYDPFTTENIMSIRSPDCTFFYFPPTPGHKPWTNKMVYDFYKPLEKGMDRMDIEVYRMIEDPEQNTMDVWITMRVHWKKELRIEPYEGTYVWGLEFSPDQEQVSKFLEHVDRSVTPIIWQKYCEGQKLLGGPPPTLPSFD
ncbi:uncharacterized protein Z518_03607 [Rhinocladiella mackenziei CBS 650.93]|uniref:SnoaL-like domain-containing protein n=1 Tax=Rhinocladiella mackenziei CBS 650.93 TaxID=1442369 RepID=A0A0D2J940_9EURO|nr:uncharacterized protein Z518_03607 [Rhinocladiella mackenziei CBS 650.93]KIX05635.1 hypothetical protein Z518_03607 [Rhinocladiella mackenziei CBS 650.93]